MLSLGKEGEMSKFMLITTTAFCFFVTGGIAAGKAPQVGVPEIDPGFASGAIALLVCGVITMASRFGRK